MKFVQQLEAAPKNLVLYFLGLAGAVLDDYTLITLAVFSGLVGAITRSVLIPLATFFGLYFVLRLVANIADVIGFHANSTGTGHHQQAQATLQVAAALAQFHPPQQQGAMDA